MSDNEFPIKITGDASQAKAAIGAAKEQLDKASKSVEMLADLIGVKIPDALTKLIASSELAGPALEAIFPVVAGLAAIDVLHQLGEKLGALISDTFIFTDAQKDEDAALRASNKALYDATLRVKQYGRERQIAAEATEAGKDKLRLQFNLEDIGGSSAALKAQIQSIDDQITELQKKVARGIDTSKIAKPQDDLRASITSTSRAIDEQRNVLSGYSAQIKKLQSDRERLHIAFIQAEAVEKKGAQDISNDLALENAARLQKSIQTNIAQVEADKRSSDAEIQQKQQVIRELAAAHQISAEDELSLNKTILDQKFAQDETALQKKLEQLSRDPERNATQIITVQGEIKALTTQHYTELEKLNADYYKQVEHNGQEAVNKAATNIRALLQQVKESQQIILEAAKAHETALGQLAEQRLAFDLSIGKISESEYERRLAIQLEKTYENEKAKLNLKLEAAKGDMVETARINAELEKLEDKHNADLEKADENSYKRRTKIVDAFFSHMKSGMDSAISGMLKGTESFSKAMQQMWADMVVSVAQYLADMMLKWVQHHVAMLVVHATEKEGEVAADASAAAESKGISLADAIAKIHHSAAAAASRVYEAEAPLGPVIAGLLAAGTYTAVLGFKALASAEGGQYYVPNNQLTMLHPQEMVLPAGIANQMRSVIGGGGSGGSGVTVVVNNSVSAVDAASFQGHIRRHSNMIANEVTRALKRKGVR